MDSSSPKRSLSRIVAHLKDKYRSKRQSTSIAPPQDATPAPKPTLTVDDLDDHSRTQYERAQRLFARWDIDLPLQNYPVNPGIQRVERKVRIRVIRTCHSCQKTFGAELVCTQCNHTRCKKCPRYPERKNTGKTAPKTKPPKEKPVVPAPVTLPIRVPRIIETGHVLRRPPKVETQDRIRRPVTMRVARECHICFVEIPPKDRVCPECEHPRCSKCPRRPPKTSKYPNGYPGDSHPEPPQPDISKRRVVFTCDQCKAVFDEGEKLCSCGHQLCSNCDRQPPLKSKSKPTITDLVEAIHIPTPIAETLKNPEPDPPVPAVLSPIDLAEEITKLTVEEPAEPVRA